MADSFTAARPERGAGFEANSFLDEKQRTYDGVDEALRTNLWLPEDLLGQRRPEILIGTRT